jgi:predicted ATP-dependent endonuclease of OLD family
MISSIEISLFRGIRECRIDDLEAINVFVGRNNHGKSSILEALYLASAAFKFEDPWSMEQQQGSTPRHRTSDKISFLLNRRTERNLTWGRDRETLWHNYDRKDPIKINVVRKRKKLRIRRARLRKEPLF